MNPDHRHISSCFMVFYSCKTIGKAPSTTYIFPFNRVIATGKGEKEGEREGKQGGEGEGEGERGKDGEKGKRREREGERDKERRNKGESGEREGRKPIKTVGEICGYTIIEGF